MSNSLLFHLGDESAVDSKVNDLLLGKFILRFVVP